MLILAIIFALYPSIPTIEPALSVGMVIHRTNVAVSLSRTVFYMLKRLAATDFDQRLIGDLVATFVKPCRDFCSLSAIVFLSQRGCSTFLFFFFNYVYRAYFGAMLELLKSGSLVTFRHQATKPPNQVILTITFSYKAMVIVV